MLSSTDEGRGHRWTGLVGEGLIKEVGLGGWVAF